MTGPVRIQLSRRKGFRLAEAADNNLPTVKVDRTTRWGNPFDFRKSEHCWTALAFGCKGNLKGRIEASVKAFRAWVAPADGRRIAHQEFQVCIGDTEKNVPIAPKAEAGMAPSTAEIRADLRGKNLACWCPLPAPGEVDCCHAAVLLEIANAPETST